MKEKVKKFYKNYKISPIQDICDNMTTQNNLGNLFNQINTLNDILTKTLPLNLLPFCRIGSIDQNKNQVILFVTDQQAYHILRSFSEHIIQAFYNNGFHFNSIITKVATVSHNPPKTKGITLDIKQKESLAKLAIALGKPEIIIDD